MKSDLHKVLHPIAGHPMLLHLLGAIGEVGVARTVIVAGDRREQIEAALAGTGSEVVVQEPQLGTAHAALQAKAALADFRGSCWSVLATCRSWPPAPCGGCAMRCHRVRRLPCWLPAGRYRCLWPDHR